MKDNWRNCSASLPIAVSLAPVRKKRSELRRSLPPSQCRFNDRGGRQRDFLFKGPANNLYADRQACGRAARRDDYARQPKYIDGLRATRSAKDADRFTVDRN